VVRRRHDRLDERVATIQALEHQGDEIDNEIAARLERSFITPFDREDIHELYQRLDDIVDALDIRAERLAGDANHVLYSFAVRAGRRLLVEGRISVALGAAVFAPNWYVRRVLHAQEA